MHAKFKIFTKLRSNRGKNITVQFSVVIVQYCSGNLLPKRNIILEHMMYCDFTTDGGTTSQNIHNTCNSEKLLNKHGEKWMFRMNI